MSMPSFSWPRPDDLQRVVGRLNKLIVSVYKLIGFVILGAVVLGVVVYIGLRVFYFMRRAWILPMIVTSSDPQVLDLQSRVVHEVAAREKLLVEQAELRARFERATGVIELESGYRDDLRVALEEDLKRTRRELKRLSGLDGRFRRSAGEIALVNQAYSGYSRDRLARELDAQLIDRDQYLAGEQRIAGIAESNLTLAEREARIATESEALSLEVRALERVREAVAAGRGREGSGPLSYDVARIQYEYGRAQLELAAARTEQESTREGVEALDRAIAGYDSLVGLIESASLLRAVREPLHVAQIPYENAGHAEVGTPVYGCALTVVWCRRVGKVVELLEGEVLVRHPVFGHELRGQLVSMELVDAKWLREPVLHLERPPLFF